MPAMTSVTICASWALAWRHVADLILVLRQLSVRRISK